MPNDKSTPEFGLMANGSCGRWTFEIDESLRSDVWTMSIDGPQIYLVFRLQNLEVPRKALEFLNSQIIPRPSRTTQSRATSGAALKMGRLGSAHVTLLNDDEDPPRCFIIIGARGRSTVRVSLQAEDIRSCAGALGEVVKDLEPALHATSAESRSA